MRNLRIGIAILLAAGGLPGAAAADEGVLGQWRLQRAAVAPWTEEAPIDRTWIGRWVEFNADHVKGPGPLSCANARYEATLMPAEGLFQGGLPAPAENAAHTVGLAEFPVAGVSMTCDTGIFEFHEAGTALLFALDNVIWTLDRSPGAFAAAKSPAVAVQSFLEAHFNGDMGFDEETVAAKEKFLSKALKEKIKAYFAQEFPPEEAPPINGDPFTDSQEYPTRFAVGSATVSAKTAEVPVEYADGFVVRSVVFNLAKSGSRWRIDDVDYDHGGTLTRSLAAKP